MRRIVYALLFLTSTSLWAENTGNLRFIIHTTPTIGEQKMAVWVIMPNLSRKPDKQLVIFGPRFEGKNWWFEPMAGTFIEKGATTPLFDVRGRYTRGRYSSFVLVQWVNPGKDLDIAPDIEFSYELAKGLYLGVETDNEFGPGEDTLSIGPHVGLVLNKEMYVAVAYQFHRQGGNQLWVRLVWKPSTN